jgi:hypothetical protein
LDALLDKYIDSDDDEPDEHWRKLRQHRMHTDDTISGKVYRLDLMQPQHGLISSLYHFIS